MRAAARHSQNGRTGGLRRHAEAREQFDEAADPDAVDMANVIAVEDRTHLLGMKRAPASELSPCTGNDGIG